MNTSALHTEQLPNLVLVGLGAHASLALKGQCLSSAVPLCVKCWQLMHALGSVIMLSAGFVPVVMTVSNDPS